MWRIRRVTPYLACFVLGSGVGAVVHEQLMAIPSRISIEEFQFDDIDLPKTRSLLVSPSKRFIVEYDYSLGGPRWVCEKLSHSTDVKGINNIRKGATFKADSRIPQHFRSKPSDFTSSGFDRGHLAAAANHKHNTEDYEATFLMNNISPQVKELNRDLWRKLEKYALDLTDIYENVYVISGPLFIPERDENKVFWRRYMMLGGKQGKIAVPTHFFKVICILMPPGSSLTYDHETQKPIPNSRRYLVSAFIVPNASSIPASRSLSSFQVPLDRVQKLSGIQLLQSTPRDSIRTLTKEHPCS